MTTWIYKLKIKQFLDEEETVTAMKAAYNGIRRELQKVPIRSPSNFHRYAKLGIREDDINLFNLGMDALYDWGDRYRVWLG